MVQTLVQKRNMAIQAMVEEACQSSHGHSQKSQLRPLHMMDFHHEDLREIDLTAAAVMAGEGSQHFQNGLATVGAPSGSGASR